MPSVIKSIQTYGENIVVINDDDKVKRKNNEYLVKRVERYYVKEQVAYTWGILIPVQNIKTGLLNGR